mgnify:CR=1 FL=1
MIVTCFAIIVWLLFACCFLLSLTANNNEPISMIRTPGPSEVEQQQPTPGGVTLQLAPPPGSQPKGEGTENPASADNGTLTELKPVQVVTVNTQAPTTLPSFGQYTTSSK